MVGKYKHWMLIGVMVIVAAGIFVHGNGPALDEYDIQDKCGRIVNLFQHTINDEGDCTVQCMNLCRAKDKEYAKVVFLESESGCNECSCFCEK